MAMTGGTAKLVKEEYANYGNSNWTIKLYVYYKTSQDNANNKSTITVGMYVVTPSGYDIGTWTDYGGSYVGTSSLTFDGTIPNFSGTRWLVENKTFTVNHNSDGTGTATIYWKWGVRSNWGGYYEPSSSFTITLPTIPRASSITTATDKTLGNACSIKWTPASSSFTYKLKFKLGDWEETTGTISPKTTSAYTYTDYVLPLEVADELPKATSGTMTAYLYTYSGSTQIGSTASKTFTVKVPDSIKPSISSVSATLVNTNSVINGWGIAVAGYTKVKVSASASGSYSSTISSFTISGGYSTTQNGTSLAYTGGVISSSGSKTFTVVAKDSRSRSSKAKSATAITFYAYSKPTVSSFTVARSSSNAKKVVVKANWTFSSVNNKNAATATLYYKKSSNTSWTTYGTITKNTNVTLTNDFEETSSYNFKVVVTDSLSNSAQEEGFISTIEVTMDFRAGGKGLGIGKIAETDNLEIAFDTIFMGNVYIQNDDGTKTSLADYIRSLI